jgi:DedD protein
MDTRLKERLVGAVALVLIVVLVVPELLTGPRRPQPPAASDAPAQVRVVVVDLAHSEAGPVVRPAADAAPVLAPVTVPTAPAGAATAATAATAASAPATDADGAAPPPPALAAAPPLRGAMAPAVTVPTTVAEAPKAAPAQTEIPKAEAAKTVAANPVATKPAGEVPVAPAPVSAKPAVAEAPKAAPAEPQKSAAHPPKVSVAAGEGWVVQLGSFASRENGEKLAKVLRGKGYRAFVSEFRGSGRILYRVRVGPEQDRSRAESIAARLSRDGYNGSVAPH